jgi:hypothetical protein
LTGATTPANDSQSPDLTARPLNRFAIQSKRALLKGLNQPILVFDLKSNKQIFSKITPIPNNKRVKNTEPKILTA